MVDFTLSHLCIKKQGRKLTEFNTFFKNINRRNLYLIFIQIEVLLKIRPFNGIQKPSPLLLPTLLLLTLECCIVWSCFTCFYLYFYFLSKQNKSMTHFSLYKPLSNKKTSFLDLRIKVFPTNSNGVTLSCIKLRIFELNEFII